MKSQFARGPWSTQALTLAGFGVGLLAPAPSRAEVSPIGVWTRDNGGLRVQVARCGPHLCGVIVRQDDKASRAKVGQTVLSGMAPSGPATWKGTAWNPSDGKSYSGTMRLVGDTLTTSGCVMGVICQSVAWTRGK